MCVQIQFRAIVTLSAWLSHARGIGGSGTSIRATSTKRILARGRTLSYDYNFFNEVYRLKPTMDVPQHQLKCACCVLQTCACSPRVLRGELLLTLGSDRSSIDFTSMASLPVSITRNGVRMPEVHFSEMNLSDTRRRGLFT